MKTNFLIKFKNQQNAPECLLTCFCGIMIWHDWASFVFGMVWFSRQMARTTCDIFTYINKPIDV